jgi:hypothetical protein
MTQEIIKNENIKIQQMVESYLRFRSATPNEAEQHFDEDALNAFVEGDLNARENNVFMGHLADCGFCLHKTAELALLQAAFENDEAAAPAVSAQPTRISEVMSGLFSRLFGNFEADQTVFAHSEEKEKEPVDEGSDDQKEKS